jgi:O-antigen ligase
VLRVDRSEFARAGLEEYLEISNAAQVTDSLGNILKEKENVTVWMSFYWHYGRLESTDPTTNWRLDIWQDVVYDLVEENRVLLGYGYNEIFPQMLDPEAPGRLGKDGLNENVHNYFVNIIGRGGIIQLILFILFHYSLVTYWKENVSNYQILMYIVPSFVVSSLDITMEGVQYPLIYYFFLYYFLKNSTKVKVVELYG